MLFFQPNKYYLQALLRIIRLNRTPLAYCCHPAHHQSSARMQDTDYSFPCVQSAAGLWPCAASTAVRSTHRASRYFLWDRSITYALNQLICPKPDPCSESTVILQTGQRYPDRPGGAADSGRYQWSASACGHSRTGGRHAEYPVRLIGLLVS